MLEPNQDPTFRESSLLIKLKPIKAYQSSNCCHVSNKSAIYLLINTLPGSVVSSKKLYSTKKAVLKRRYALHFSKTNQKHMPRFITTVGSKGLWEVEPAETPHSWFKQLAVAIYISTNQ